MQNAEILVLPVISLMGLAFAYSHILRFSQNAVMTFMAFGVLFGISIVLAMAFPIKLGEGFIFDLRTLLLGLCVLFAGWRAGLIALGIAVGFRLYLGGGGVASGIAALFVAYSIAVSWRIFAVPKIKNGALADLGLGVVINGSFASLVLMPKDIAFFMLTNLAPIIASANIVGTVAIGFVFRREMKFFQDAQKLRTYAMIDPLTNLLNRRGTEESLKHVTHFKDTGRALLLFDMDDFKRVNDQHGHEAGDIALATIASRLENVMRGDVVFSRHGGDEFTVYFPAIDSVTIGSVAERLCRTVSREPVMYRETDLRVTISAGCFWTVRQTSFAEMLLKADEQLLMSKKNGRNRATIYLDLPKGKRVPAETVLAYAGTTRG